MGHDKLTWINGWMNANRKQGFLRSERICTGKRTEFRFISYRNGIRRKDILSCKITKFNDDIKSTTWGEKKETHSQKFTTIYDKSIKSLGFRLRWLKGIYHVFILPLKFYAQKFYTTSKKLRIIIFPIGKSIYKWRTR